MITDIPHNKRIAFKKSFLKNVQFVISYPSFEMESEKKEVIISNFEKHGFKVKSKEELPYVEGSRNKTVIAVTPKGAFIIIDKEDYTGYESLKAYITQTTGLLIEIGIKECTNLVFQKQNVFKLEKNIDGLKYTKEHIFNILFTKEVVDNIPVFGKTEDGCIYTAQPLYKEEEKYVLAELLVSAMLLKSKDMCEVAEVADDINENLYDLWYVSVTDAVRGLMNRE